MELHASNLHEIESVKCPRRMGFLKIHINKWTNLSRSMKIQNIKWAASKFNLHFKFRASIQPFARDLPVKKRDLTFQIAF